MDSGRRWASSVGQRGCETHSDDVLASLEDCAEGRQLVGLFPRWSSGTVGIEAEIHRLSPIIDLYIQQKEHGKPSVPHSVPTLLLMSVHVTRTMSFLLLLEIPKTKVTSPVDTFATLPSSRLTIMSESECRCRDAFGRFGVMMFCPCTRVPPEKVLARVH